MTHLFIWRNRKISGKRLREYKEFHKLFSFFSFQNTKYSIFEHCNVPNKRSLFRERDGNFFRWATVGEVIREKRVSERSQIIWIIFKTEGNRSRYSSIFQFCPHLEISRPNITRKLCKNMSIKIKRNSLADRPLCGISYTRFSLFSHQFIWV